jgi:predicted GTPase
MGRKKVIILGAAGRDFHNFNTVYRERDDVEVVAFTATQIPEIQDRRYPPSLAGPRYPDGIPIVDEAKLADLIGENGVDEAIFSYSDVSFGHLGQVASRVIAAGARFVLLPESETAIEADKPVISVCAVRTGSGKSQTSRYVAGLLRSMDRRVAAIRHPMPYGDLSAQAVQVFASNEDMDAADCTIEEREEYEHYVALGFTVYAGVDYQAILDRALPTADVVLWDGGNNDTSFYRSDLHIVVLDPLRAGHETRYHPGMVNLLTADAFVVNKVDRATPEQIEAVLAAARRWNPGAEVIRAESRIEVSDPDRVRGKRVLCVEDGPTLTHGEMSIGAAYVAAERLGAEIVDPRTFAVGSIGEAFAKYSHLGPVLPALGYFPEQLEELRQTIARADVDSVLIGTPIDLRRLVEFEQPAVRVSYRLAEVEGQATRLEDLVKRAVE